MVLFFVLVTLPSKSHSCQPIKWLEVFSYCLKTIFWRKSTSYELHLCGSTSISSIDHPTTKVVVDCADIVAMLSVVVALTDHVLSFSKAEMPATPVMFLGHYNQHKFGLVAICSGAICYTKEAEFSWPFLIFYFGELLARLDRAA